MRSKSFLQARHDFDDEKLNGLSVDSYFFDEACNLPIPDNYSGRRQEQYEFSAKVAGCCILAALIIIITVIIL